ncbi:hypothetical protein [Alishewanella longhuensis]
MSITNHQAKYFAHELTIRHAAGGVDSLSQSLFDASVDLNPHQINAALFALNNPLSQGVVLADEVGLGKTIEAGLDPVSILGRASSKTTNHLPCIFETAMGTRVIR